MVKDQKPEKNIWGIVINCLLGIIALIFVVLVVFAFIRITIWDLPLLHLAAAIFILISSIFYLFLKRIKTIPLWKVRLLIGLTAASFLLLIMTSGIAIVGALISF